MENTATPRQRWALFCITKKDYRDEILSKEEAARLIKELGDPNYKKASKKDKTESLGDRLEKYLVDNFDKLFKACGESMKIKSIVEDDPMYTKNPKKYAFIGFGCGITYFTYRKNNLKAKEIAERAKTLLRGKISDMFLARFTPEEQRYYENIGCPLLAIFSQDINIQQTYYSMVVKWAEENGVKMDYKSFLD